MKFIIGEKFYDTDNSELICAYGKPCVVKNLFMEMKINKIAKLYKTQKGSWFSVVERDHGIFEATREDDEYVKDIFRHNGTVGLYNEHFNELEEA